MRLDTLAPSPLGAARAFVVAHPFVVLACALATVVSLYLVLAQSLNHLVRNDDAFYYFTIARNFALEPRWTFDRLRDTNGVQPLWAAILSAAAWLLARLGVTDPFTLVRAFLCLAVAAHVGSGVYLYRAAAAWLRPRDRNILLALWLFSPALVVNQLTGMENAVYALLLALVAYLFLRLGPEAPARDHALFGAALGLLFLARVDSLILVGLLGLILLARGLRPAATTSRRARMARLVLAGTVTVLVVAPYLAYNLLTFQELTPISGAVKSAQADSIIRGLGGLGSPDHLAYTLSFLARTVAIMVWRAWASVALLSGAWAAVIYPVAAFGRTSLTSYLLNTAVVVALLGAGWAWLARYARPPLRAMRADLRHRMRALAPAWWFALFAALQFGAYTLRYPHMLAYSGAGWYFVPQYLIMAVLGALVLGVVLDWLRSLPRLARVEKPAFALLALNLLLYVHVVAVLPSPAGPMAAKVEAAAWMADNLPPETIVGSHNAGALGYFARQRVVNLDGLVNDFAYLEALRQGRVPAYARDTGIAYLSDYTPSAGRPVPGARWLRLMVDALVAEFPSGTGTTEYVVRIRPGE